jgi:hypothetical protein
MISHSSFRSIGLIVLGLALSGCGGTTPAPTLILAPVNATPLVLSTTVVVTPVATNPVPPAESAVPPALPTAKITPTRTPTVPAGSMRIKIFMVAMNDAGKQGKKIGCDDSIVSVDRTVPTTVAALRASITELLSVHDRDYGQLGLYNALYQSTLQVDDIGLVSGRATIYLSGKVILGGECDSPRVDAQIKETALQFSTVKQVSVFVNKIALDQILSGKGN